MKSLLTKLPVFIVSLAAGLLSVIFAALFLSAQYKSEVIFEITSVEKENYSFGLLDGISGSNIQELYKIQQYLYTPDAISSFAERVPISDIYSNSSIKEFSKLPSKNSEGLDKYFKKHIKLKIDPDAHTMSISGYAYKPEDSKLVVLELVSMVNNFIVQRSRVDALIKQQYILCDLFFSKDELPMIQESSIKLKNSILNISESAKEILLGQAKQDSQNCINNLERNYTDNIEEIALNTLFPKSVMNDLQSNFSKNILESYYNNVANLLSQNSSIGIIAEPKEPTESESRNFILSFMITFIITYILILSCKILVNLTDEFKL